MSDEIDGFAPDDLENTARENFNVGSDAGLPTDIRFRSNVMRLLRKRSARSDAASDPIKHAVFVLGGAPALSEFTPFFDDGASVLSGRLWFVNEALHSAHSIPLPDQPPAMLVEYVAKALGFGKNPCVVLNPSARPTETRFYPSGLDAIDEVMIAKLEDEIASEETIRAVVERAYRQALVTPQMQKDPHVLWERATTWIPVKKAEDCIAGLLAASLQGRFCNHIVRREINVDEGGRVDIEVSRPDFALRVHRVDAVLELKVLRSFWNSGASVSQQETREHIEGGVDQAYDYKEKRLAGSGALYCFDMRKGIELADCFGHVKAKAEHLCVTLRSWRVYNSTRAARAATVASKSGAVQHE